jgi:hypothetical protein
MKLIEEQKQFIEERFGEWSKFIKIS